MKLDEKDKRTKKGIKTIKDIHQMLCKRCQEKAHLIKFDNQQKLGDSSFSRKTRLNTQQELQCEHIHTLS